MSNWKSISAHIRKYLNLPTYPVGIKLVEDRKDLSGRKFHKVNLCQLVAMARYLHRTASVVRENHVCALGGACIGLIKTPQRIARGEINVGTYAKDKEAAERFQRSIQKLRDKGKRYDGVMAAPLDHMPFEPQVIVLYLTPGRATRMVHACAYHSGEGIEAKLVAEAALCSAIARVIELKKPTLGLPCAGDRRYASVREEELIFAFPSEWGERITEGLARTHKAGVSQHPFKPFLDFTPVMRGGFETTPEDL